MPKFDETNRARFGIRGLDQVLTGGVPRSTFFLIEGRPGSGKTTLALQFLLEGVRQGESCVLMSNSETPRQLKSVADSHGWSLDGINVIEWTDASTGDRGYDDSEYTLFPEAEVEVGETLARLFFEFDRLKPSRLVIDTISVLRILAPSAAFYGRQLRRIRDVVSAYDCTTILVDETAISEKDFRSQTLADGLLELEQLDFQYGGTRRRLRVRKLRSSRYIEGSHDFTIATGGVVVFPRLIATDHQVRPLAEPARSGLEELDALAGGGLPRGSSTLLMGPAGSGKSTLGSLYMHAAALRGERTSLLLFDESPATYIARSEGLGLKLASQVEAGQVILSALDPAELSPGQIAHQIVEEVEKENCALVIIDSMNGYLHSAAEEPMVFLHLRELLSYLSRRGIVTLLTLTQHGILGSEMATPIDVSFLSDNVFLLRYFEIDGGIRQALSMVKKRSGPHERTIRELHMSAAGVSLSQPLDQFSAVLGGTPVYSSTSTDPETTPR